MAAAAAELVEPARRKKEAGPASQEAGFPLAAKSDGINDITKEASKGHGAKMT